MRRQVDKKIIEEISGRIASRFHPERIILFGSWAWGKPNEDSDVDFFIVKDVDDTRELAREIDSYVFPRPFPMDIVVCKPTQFEERKKTGDYFINEIIKRGEVLYAA